MLHKTIHLTYGFIIPEVDEKKILRIHKMSTVKLFKLSVPFLYYVPKERS